MRASWIDGDAAPEGSFSVDLQTKTWTLDANQMVRVPTFRGKGIGWSERWVPSLTGIIKYSWDVPLGNGQVRHMFGGLINLPGMSTARPVEVQGGFNESTGSVTINLFGNVFTITGWRTDGDQSSAEITDQNTGVNTLGVNTQTSGTGNQPIAMLPGGFIVNQGSKE